MFSFADALKTIDLICNPINGLVENSSVVNALGRILASDQQAKIDIPPFNRSAMDGYAILQNDKSVAYQIIETVAAGETVTASLFPGTAIKIMTGAPVPLGTGKVVPIENVDENQGKITILQEARSANISWQGEDIKSGEIIIKAGTTLGPAEIANLIAVGITEIPVYLKPKIAIISTGDEIVENFQDLKSGKIMNSNGPMLQALCAQHGLEISKVFQVRDDYTTTVATIKQALDVADIIIMSGGVSVGDFDYVNKALCASGVTLHFDKIAIKPGRPTTFGSKDNKLVFGLPGNPVAVFLTFYIFVLHAIKSIFKQQPSRRFFLPLAKNFVRKSSDRLEFVPCTLLANGTLLPLEFHGSAHLAALLECNGFFIINEGIAEVLPNQKVEFFHVRHS